MVFKSGKNIKIYQFLYNQNNDKSQNYVKEYLNTYILKKMTNVSFTTNDRLNEKKNLYQLF